MKKSHKKQLLNIGFVLLFAGLTFLVLYLSSDELNISSLLAFFDDCNGWLIGAAVGFMLLYAVFEALSLHVILRRFGHRPRFLSSLAYSASDVYYSGITPSATGGQPASAFYMVRDGIPGGTACFSLVFNLVGYTAALLLIGTVVLVSNLSMFLSFSVLVKLFIILGFVMQISLLVLFIACIKHPGVVLKIGNFFIALLCRIHIIKRKEKWRNKVVSVVEKYRGCFDCFKHHRGLFWQVLLFNVAQRASLILVSSFVCLAATDCSVWETFCMQAFAMMGYNSIPLPGGSGAFEFLYISIYEHTFTAQFTLIAMMVTRVISYYISMLISGIYTTLYHVFAKSAKQVAQEGVTQNEKEGFQDEQA